MGAFDAPTYKHMTQSWLICGWDVWHDVTHSSRHEISRNSYHWLSHQHTKRKGMVFYFRGAFYCCFYWKIMSDGPLPLSNTWHRVDWYMVAMYVRYEMMSHILPDMKPVEIIASTIHCGPPHKKMNEGFSILQMASICLKMYESAWYLLIFYIRRIL